MRSVGKICNIKGEVRESNSGTGYFLFGEFFLYGFLLHLKVKNQRYAILTEGVLHDSEIFVRRVQKHRRGCAHLLELVPLTELV